MTCINYSYLLVGCDKGYIYVYQRKNNGKQIYYLMRFVYLNLIMIL